MPSLLLEDDPTSSLYGEDRHRANPVVSDDPDERTALAALYAGVSRAMAQTTKLQQEAGADGLLGLAAYSQPGGAQYEQQRWGQNLPGAGTRLSPNFRTTDPSRLTVDPMELRYDYGEGRTTLPPQNWIGPEREA